MDVSYRIEVGVKAFEDSVPSLPHVLYIASGAFNTVDQVVALAVYLDFGAVFAAYVSTGDFS